MTIDRQQNEQAKEGKEMEMEKVLAEMDGESSMGTPGFLKGMHVYMYVCMYVCLFAALITEPHAWLASGHSITRLYPQPKAFFRKKLYSYTIFIIRN